jgi:hypothetical protein
VRTLPQADISHSRDSFSQNTLAAQGLVLHHIFYVIGQMRIPLKLIGNSG